MVDIRSYQTSGAFFNMRLRIDDWYLPKSPTKVNSFIGSVCNVLNMTEIARYIELRLADIGMGQNDFAKLVGISPSHLNNILKSRKQSNAKTRQKIPIKSASLWADALKLTGEERFHFLTGVLKQDGHPVVAEVLTLFEDMHIETVTNRDKLTAQFKEDSARLSAQIADLSLLVARLSQESSKDGKSGNQ